LVNFSVHLVYFVATWDTLWSFGIFSHIHFGMLYLEKSGNPGQHLAWMDRTKMARYALWARHDKAQCSTAWSR
jgi:hypothetical protein